MSALLRGVHKEVDMAHLERCLHRVLEIDRRGGRLFQRDNETVVLMDCNNFSSEHIECLQIVYPQLMVTVVQSDTSASGFLILFQLASSAFRRTAAQLAFHLIIFACSLYALAIAHARQSALH
ncbi:MAG: hypothetical protein EBR09_07480 [Proteobacteria bacterium]|jgi:hypothetical protein|nr:hypothetical protein [Pseudomonadota bacterium]